MKRRITLLLILFLIEAVIVGILILSLRKTDNVPVPTQTESEQVSTDTESSLEEKVRSSAEAVLASITEDGMSKMEVAFEIYRWCTHNITYVNDSDKSDWLKAADVAFTTRAGDCYNYFAAAKALFVVAGIDNIDVVKSDTSESSHYWSLINLGNGWYHFDTTPRAGKGDRFFMVTDEELLAYSKANGDSHIFDSSLYPERATQSVQEQVDYENGKIKE